MAQVAWWVFARWPRWPALPLCGHHV